MLNFLASYWWLCGIGCVVGVVVFFLSAAFATALSKDNTWASLLAFVVTFLGWLMGVSCFLGMFIGIVCAIVRFAQTP